MELLHLHYFMMVGKYSNITKAARAAYTSQSNISKQIAALEDELDTTLFLRTNAGVELTSAGRRLYDGLGDILPKLDGLFEEVSGTGRGQLPTVRLGLCDTMDLERILPDFIQQFYEAHHNRIAVDLKPCDVNELSEMLAVGAIDCAFIFNIVDIKIPGVARMKINRANPCLYYSEKHPLCGKPDLSVMDFENETFVHTAGSERFDQFEALPYQPKHIVEEKTLNAAFLYISTGRAVSVFGPSQNRLGRSDIHTIELPTRQQVGTDAFWLKGKETPALLEFLRFLREKRTYREEE